MQVPLSEVQFHMMDREAMRKRIQMKTFPPRIPFTVECDGTSRKLSSRITINGAKPVETEEEVFFTIRASLLDPVTRSKRSLKVAMCIFYYYVCRYPTPICNGYR